MVPPTNVKFILGFAWAESAPATTPLGSADDEALSDDSPENTTPKPSPTPVPQSRAGAVQDASVNTQRATTAVAADPTSAPNRANLNQASNQAAVTSGILATEVAQGKYDKDDYLKKILPMALGFMNSTNAIMKPTYDATINKPPTSSQPLQTISVPAFQVPTAPTDASTPSDLGFTAGPGQLVNQGQSTTDNETQLSDSPSGKNYGAQLIVVPNSPKPTVSGGSSAGLENQIANLGDPKRDLNSSAKTPESVASGHIEIKALSEVNNDSELAKKFPVDTASIAASKTGSQATQANVANGAIGASHGTMTSTTTVSLNFSQTLPKGDLAKATPPKKGNGLTPAFQAHENPLAAKAQKELSLGVADETVSSATRQLSSLPQAKKIEAKIQSSPFMWFMALLTGFAMGGAYLLTKRRGLRTEPVLASASALSAAAFTAPRESSYSDLSKEKAVVRQYPENSALGDTVIRPSDTTSFRRVSFDALELTKVIRKKDSTITAVTEVPKPVASTQEFAAEWEGTQWVLYRVNANGSKAEHCGELRAGSRLKARILGFQETGWYELKRDKNWVQVSDPGKCIVSVKKVFKE